MEQRRNERVHAASPKHRFVVQAPRPRVIARSLLTNPAGGGIRARMEAIYAIVIFILAMFALNRIEFGRFD